MKLEITLDNSRYELDPHGYDISIPLQFNGPQPNTYGVPKAKAHAYEGQGFVGDVSRGGSCNFEVYKFIPHCNGTHTECVGHLTEEKVSIHKLLTESLCPATLISVPLSNLANSDDSYQPPLNDADLFVSLDSLKTALKNSQESFLQALVIRTLPNHPNKTSRNYMEAACPFLSNEAMSYIYDLGVRHLLVDFPSVDRLFDEGKLSNHRIYWGLETAETATPGGGNLKKTITEMVYVPSEVLDGPYILELQIAAFVADAAPSRPRLFVLKS